MVALCIVIAQAAIATAERRPVAVVELSDGAGQKLADSLLAALNNHADLKPIDETDTNRALYGDLRDEVADRMSEVQTHLKAAEQLFESRGFPEAANKAFEGHAKLFESTPTGEVVRLFADLTFVVAQARLGDRKPTDAAAMFRLVHQLNPEFKPNAARTYPEVITAFESAKRAPAGTGVVHVNGNGTIVIDGKDVGPAPGAFDVAAGLHVIWLVGPEREPRGKLATVEPQKKTEVDLPDAPTPLATKVRRVRLALKKAPDTTARAGAMQQLASLVRVRDAVLIYAASTGSGTALVIQTWRDRAPGFSSRHEMKASEKPADILEPLAPKKKPVPIRKDPPIRIPIVEKRWYEKPRYWGLGGGIALSIIVGTVIAFRRWDREIPLDTNPTFDPGTIAR